MRNQATRWYLAVGLALIATNLLVPSELVRQGAYLLAAGSAPVAVLVGVRRRRPAARAAWLLLAGGFASWLVADAGWIWLEGVLGVDPSGTWVEAFYLGAYPLMAAGLFLLARDPRPRGQLAGLLDAVSITLVVALVVGVLVVQPTLEAAGGSWSEQLLLGAYPFGDLVVVLQLTYLWTQSRRGLASTRLLLGSMFVFLVTDLLFQAASVWAGLDGIVPSLDAGWMLGYLLGGAAALHPSMSLVSGHRSDDDAFSLGRVLTLGAAFATIPVLGLVVEATGRPHPTVVIETAHVVLVLLVVVRLLEVVRTIRIQKAGLARLAATDVITGLENRRRFVERCSAVLDPEERRPAAVLMVGLQRYAEINETLGYRTGDELLRTVGAVLGGLVGSAGTVARLGGDVFGVLLPDHDADRAGDLARLVRGILVEPLSVSGMSITVDGAVGIVMLPVDADRAEDVLARADVALAAAGADPAGVARYSREVAERGGSAPQLMAELKRALDDGDVVVHFQPQVEIATGRVIGAEALARWRHPARGLIPPADFIPAAERTGLIRLLTLVVLDRAVAQASRWQDEGRGLTVAVNLSVRNLLDAHLVDDVRASLDRHGLPASRLELEITETTAMVDPTRAAAVLGDLAELGVVLSVDDYGTGYGSLAYLQRLPVRRLKIDRSFVTGLLGDPASSAIVHSTVDLARHLGLSVVAEGVEDLDTLRALREMHCFAAQGFGLSRPVPAERLAEAIARIEEVLSHGPAGVAVTHGPGAEVLSHGPAGVSVPHPRSAPSGVGTRAGAGAGWGLAHEP
ncbi:EAL domain-containing protein [Actinotalea sp. M2MS4P-6]|uniref:putative bifunctional diguanylate cyclase/phosphodiesterase n=1 Tax=Actinotalea sp. M2MS4P-6 TaxID=2983762 RepID=UPI0021E45D08|nr:EAL domain-containing protein [Actinotalea sp. M2MS4P-6]MCV2395863.1 EAL domain-containing protein [Actinotalea sp. M2MS4P-6]